MFLKLPFDTDCLGVLNERLDVQIALDCQLLRRIIKAMNNLNA